MKLENKYIELLLKKCAYSKSKSLFISYDKCNIDFINKLIVKAKEYGYNDIYKDENDITLELELLENLSIEEIKKHPYFKRETWDKAIEEQCVFLLSSTSFPNYLKNVEPTKLMAAREAKTLTQAKYLESVMNDTISWTIFGLPNKIWAEQLFPNDDKAFEKLENLIYSFCMLDDENPVAVWNQYINTETLKATYLNNLNIKEIIFQNNLGTNLTLGLVDNYIFRSLENNHCIENMPTYSIWTSPHKCIADGIVYGSMPINYKGYYINNYWFKFSKGKVIDYDAREGKQYLDSFFSKGDSYKRLGEIALIDINSQVAKTKLVYNNTLFDENISTHLAFGSAYQNTLKNGTSMSGEQLNKAGCNVCEEHMDFNIGTEDLKIIVKTYDGKEITIFKNGNFDYNLIK